PPRGGRGAFLSARPFSPFLVPKSGFRSRHQFFPSSFPRCAIPRTPKMPFFLILRTHYRGLARGLHAFKSASWEISTEFAQATQFVIDSSIPSFYHSP